MILVFLLNNLITPFRDSIININKLFLFLIWIHRKDGSVHYKNESKVNQNTYSENDKIICL